MFEGVNSYSYGPLGRLGSSLVPAPEHARESALLLCQRLLGARWRRSVHEEISEVRGGRVAGVRSLTWRRLLAGTRSRLALQGDLGGVVGAGTRWSGRVGGSDGGVLLRGSRGVLRQG